MGAEAVDGLLQTMQSTGAKGLRLAVGSPARMIDASGTAQDASSQPLTRQEILQLIGPIVPEQARRRLPQETSVDFDYASASGAFKVTILRNGIRDRGEFRARPERRRRGRPGVAAAAAPRPLRLQGCGPAPAPRGTAARPAPPPAVATQPIVTHPRAGSRDRSAVSLDGRRPRRRTCTCRPACRRSSARTATCSRSTRA